MLEKLKLNINVEKITVFHRRNNVSLTTLNQRRNLTLKQRWLWVDSKTQFCSYFTMLEKWTLYINVEKIIVFQRRNNVCLSTLNQRQKSTLFSYNMMLEKSKSLYNVEMITIFKRWNNVSLSALNQRQNLKLKQRWFWVERKIIFVLMFCSNFDGRIIDVISMHIVDSTCFFWCLFKRKKSWSLCLLLISFRYFKNESRLAVSFRCNLIAVLFQSNILCDSTVLKNSYTGQYLLWSNICYDLTP